jgi:hypothetical protein
MISFVASIMCVENLTAPSDDVLLIAVVKLPSLGEPARVPTFRGAEIQNSWRGPSVIHNIKHQKSLILFEQFKISISLPDSTGPSVPNFKQTSSSFTKNQRLAFTRSQ